MSQFKFTENDSLQKIRVTFTDKETGAVIDLTPYTPKIRFLVPGASDSVEKDMEVVNGTGSDGLADYVFLASELKFGIMMGEYMLHDAGTGEITSRSEWSALIRKRV